MSLAVVVSALMWSLLSALSLTVLSLATFAASPPQTRTPAFRLLQVDDLSYVGGFRLPASGANGDDFSYGGMPLTYNPQANSLFIGSRRGGVAEVSIPAPVVSRVAVELPVASYLQPFADPTEGHRSQIARDDVAMNGLLVLGGRLYGTGFIYYDALNAQTVSHYSRSLNLSAPTFKGMYSVWQNKKAGFVSGYMTTVPPEWEARLGGSAITGQCCIPIASRTSWGPSAFAWDPARLGTTNPLPATPLVYYTEDHPTLGPWSGASRTYGATTQIGGVALIAGTALFVGRNGVGPYCYGTGTKTESLAGSYDSGGARYCYDPDTSEKGPHAYPYAYQLWAYDLNDFAAVRAGRKKPWDVIPYGVWPFTLPTGQPVMTIGGVGYDAARQRLYISQRGADEDGYVSRPLIHVFRIRQ